MLKKLLNNKLTVSFRKYFIIGLAFTLLNILLNWLLIDIIGLYSAIGAAIVAVTLFFGKFYTCVLTNFIHKKFIGYSAVNISSMILNILFIWFLIEIIKIPTVYSTTIVVGFLFLGRFIAFKKLKLIKK